MRPEARHLVAWLPDEIEAVKAAIAVKTRKERLAAFTAIAVAGERTIWSVRCKAYSIKEAERLTELWKEALARAPVRMKLPPPKHEPVFIEPPSKARLMGCR